MPSKEYYAAHREELLERKRINRLKNRERINADKRRKYHENIEQERAKQKERYYANLEVNREKRRISCLKYRIGNRKKINEKQRIWRKNNPEKSRLSVKRCQQERLQLEHAFKRLPNEKQADMLIEFSLDYLNQLNGGKQDVRTNEQGKIEGQLG